MAKLLDEQEVATALGISVDTLRRLIEEGTFPDGIPVSNKTRKWSPKDIKAYLYLRGRIGAEKFSDPVRRTEGAGGGHTGGKRGAEAKQADKDA